MTLYNSNPTYDRRPWCELFLGWSLTFGVNYAPAVASFDGACHIVGLHFGPLGLLIGWPAHPKTP